VGVFVSFFASFIGVWFVNRNGRKRNYLLRVARKYSVSPLFGQSRLTLLRALQKPPI
jgi:hypothetical protein